MKDKISIDDRHIDVIDGIRAVSVIIVLIFHFWQQTWIFPTIKTPWLSFIKLGGRPLTAIDFTPFARCGYLFVDMMVLLSGYLLCLPLARCIIKGEPMSSLGQYFRKRAARILPSYLFCVLVIFIYELFNGGYMLNGVFNAKLALRDLFTHLTFTHMMRIDTYIGTKLNVVLWTLAVEVWFYLLFPVMVRICGGRWAKKEKDSEYRRGGKGSADKKSAKNSATIKGKGGSVPAKGKKSIVLTVLRLLIPALVLIGLSHLYIYKYVLAHGSGLAVKVDSALKALGSTISSSYLSMTINQLPAFFEVYAVGMIGAVLFVLIAKYLKRSTVMSIAATVAAFVFIWLIVRMVKACSLLGGEDAQKWQVTQRLKLSLVFMGFIMSASLAAKWFRFIFSNGLMRFLSGISYNLYIWHQWLCVKLKNDWRIPHWEGDTPPNQLGAAGKSWSIKYAIVITIAAFAAATLVTYLIEKPFARLINGGRFTIDPRAEKRMKEKHS